MKIRWFKSIALILTLAVTLSFTVTPFTSIVSAQENIFTESANDISPESTIQPQAIALGIPVAVELGKWLTALAVAAIVVNEVAAVKDIYDTVEQNRNRTDRKYYAVEYDTKNQWELKTKRALTTAEAITHIKKGTEYNVWTANSMDALALARAASSNGKVTNIENHSNTGSSLKLYYNHYHDDPRRNGHAFYGRYGKLGQISPMSIPSEEMELEIAN